MPEAIQVFVTAGSREDAERIARSMVEARLAACAQIVGPMTSVYRWQGAIETAQEFLCLLKTRRDLYPELEEAIRKIHPYQVPEIVAMPVTAGNPAYLQWLDAETRPAD
jgi:periplasmic divalent cation tolerance protein